MNQPSLGPGGTRRLLKRLRDLMAGGGSSQDRLDEVVRIIAADLVAEVCSIYVMRPGEVLELFATQGLKREAVHHTRLRVGEGLVGDIAAHARPLALADAQSHPNFAYRPETGEEVFHSLMGVPIPRGGRVLGVLAVQNRTFRDYTEEEVEALETIAMVLAELLAGAAAASAEGAAGPVETAPQLPMRLAGLRIIAGVAIGRAVLHEPRISIRQMVAENVEAELARLSEAIQGMQSALDDLFAASGVAGSGEMDEVFESFRMFAEDRGWLGRMAEAVRTGLTAEAAVQKVQQDTRIRMSQVTDPYIRERLTDLDDLAHRLLRQLTGQRGAPAAAELPREAVVIAHTMGPAELLEYDRKRLKAVVLEEGSPTAHVAIVARALGIPMVGRVGGVVGGADPGDMVIVDGDSGQVLLRPSEDVVDQYTAALHAAAARIAEFAALRELPATTRDGAPVTLLANAGLLLDLKRLADSGAAGVGLFRTEIAFMVRSGYPDVAQQAALYRRALERAGDLPVVFRTLDIGGDKLLPYMERNQDENPALGWRAIRIGLDRPIMLRQQLRALIQAASGRALHVMFPMIAEVAELDRARALLDLEIERARRAGAAMPTQIRVGAMFEVPALYWQIHALLARVDFVSVGSNDLVQFLFASDRGNPRLAERYDVLSPPVLACLRAIVDACDHADVPITLCGEMAAHPLEAMALLGVGFRRLSMPSTSIPAVKAMVRSVSVDELVRYVERLTALADHSVRDHLRAFARDHGVAI
ncbi:MAG: phosphoenolpyruvate--protein phosphotransferase [Alphaproteobacteria bacterium]|nr:phosphoenolpyruvate--protein phosphotransferase [Alphaproteobacteria bacterium]